MAHSASLGGGCQCGYVRYEVREIPDIAFYCHCRICQHLTGSPVLTLAQVPISAFAYVAGQPTIFVSSDHGERRFCPRCGSQLEFRRRPNPATVEFSIGTLDDPARIAPKGHLFTDHRIPWFDTADQLPRRKQLTE